ncbi:MAG: hypothetical protein WDW38_005711 [Sanguina aurantia]
MACRCFEWSVQEDETKQKQLEAGLAPSSIGGGGGMLPVRPEESRYYHPVRNPTGAPPPGKVASTVVAPMAPAGNSGIPVPRPPPLPAGPKPTHLMLPPPPLAPPLPKGMAPPSSSSAGIHLPPPSGPPPSMILPPPAGPPPGRALLPPPPGPPPGMALLPPPSGPPPGMRLPRPQRPPPHTAAHAAAAAPDAAAAETAARCCHGPQQPRTPAHLPRAYLSQLAAAPVPSTQSTGLTEEDGPPGASSSSAPAPQPLPPMSAPSPQPQFPAMAPPPFMMGPPGAYQQQPFLGAPMGPPPGMAPHMLGAPPSGPPRFPPPQMRLPPPSGPPPGMLPPPSALPPGMLPPPSGPPPTYSSQPHISQPPLGPPPGLPPTMLAAQQAKKDIAKTITGASTVVKRPFAQNDKTVTCMVPASVRVRRDEGEAKRHKAPEAASLLGKPRAVKEPVAPPSSDVKYLEFLTTMTDLGAFE